MKDEKKLRPEKKSAIDELKNKISESVFVILADYRGLNVAKTTELRRRLRGVRAQFQVVQNRMFKNVAKDLNRVGLEGGLTGPSAMVYGKGDVVQAAKVLKDFIKENELPVIKIGTMQGVILSREDVEKLASLPPRDVLLAQLVGTIAAPLSQLVGVLQQKVATVVYVLKAAQEKKEKATA
jgi:large subunit ribosomal protein L10